MKKSSDYALLRAPAKYIREGGASLCLHEAITDKKVNINANDKSKEIIFFILSLRLFTVFIVSYVFCIVKGHQEKPVEEKNLQIIPDCVTLINKHR